MKDSPNDGSIKQRLGVRLAQYIACRVWSTKGSVLHRDFGSDEWIVHGLHMIVA